MKKIPVLILLLSCLCPGLSEPAGFGVARSNVPVLNTAEFSRVFGGSDGGSLKTDRCGQVRELEYIALPGTVFLVREEFTRGPRKVLRVETDEYQQAAGVRLYVDSGFLDPLDERPPERTRRLPSLADIVAALKSSLGSPYVWGGNIREGVPELAGYYRVRDVPAAPRSVLTLAGLDCSGLLYQATGGWTPRNTSQLVSYGQAVPVAGKSAEEISAALKPLDLIVWNGHVVIVLDRETVIESRLECDRPGHGGVMTAPLRQRMAGIMRARRPMDSWPSVGKQKDGFVVRRWFVAP